MTLQFRGVNAMAFVNHQYEATVYLMKGTKLITGVSVMLEVQLLYEDGTSTNKGVLCLESKCIRISKPLHHVTLSYHFKESSLFHGNRKFRLQVRPLGKFADLQPAVTKPISVIKYKLKASNLLPQQFFKDQGGRDKHMKLGLQLTDAGGKPVRLSKSMPLVAQLCYEKSLQPVPNQKDILKFMSNSKLNIGTDGRTEITFRIEEVSSRHQRQNFKLYVAPDIERCPLNGDILAAYSSSVTVRSKKTGPTNRKRSRKNIQYPKAGISPEIGKCMEDAMAASKRARLDTSEAMQAVQDLIHWSTLTCDMLRSIQSQHIGYELNSDGSPNLAVKIHRCPSCYQSSSVLQNNHTSDCAMNKVLTTYTKCVGPGIASILKSIKDGAPLLDKVREMEINPRENHQVNNGWDQKFEQQKFEPIPVPPVRLVERFSSRDSLGGIWKDTQPPLIDFNSPRFLEGEHTVYYVYVKHFHNGATNLGFPAFDKGGNLKGFFQETAAGLGESMGYLSLSTLAVAAPRIQELHNEFAKTLRLTTPTSNSAIKCLRDYRDLEQMKEDICQSYSAFPVLFHQTSK